MFSVNNKNTDLMSQRIEISVIENIRDREDTRVSIGNRIRDFFGRVFSRRRKKNNIRNSCFPRLCCLEQDVQNEDNASDNTTTSTVDAPTTRTFCPYRASTNLIVMGWLLIVSLAVLYNVLFVIGRAVFWEMNNVVPSFWLVADYVCDMIYLIDTFVHAHEGYLEQGMMVYEANKRRWNYLTGTSWWYDLGSMIPTDIVYFWWDRASCQVSIPCPVIVRVNRLLRIPRMVEWFDRTETGSGYPNVIRICKVIISLSVLIHWNACLYFAISYALGFGTDNWVYNLNGPRNSSLSHQYIYSFYWSTLTLTTIGETPQPETDAEYIFVVADFLAGVLIFATIVGNIGSMISNMNVARVDFQSRMDGVKQYLSFRKVSGELETRVIRWFDYIWTECGALDEEQVLSVLPDKLKAEIAISVHLETLQKVRIFQDCEPGLLEALVLKLRLKVFSPGDYICRKGDVGKEMYIVKRGKLIVVADDGSTVYATLLAGSVFGEVSVLDIAGNRTGNRRTANVRSVGFSDLFCLAKSDLWEALSDYPEARATLTERGCQLLRKDGLLDEDVFRSAQEERQSPEEQIAQMSQLIDEMAERLNRFEEHHTANKSELLKRISTIEQSIEKKSKTGPPSNPKKQSRMVYQTKKKQFYGVVPIYYDSE